MANSRKAIIKSNVNNASVQKSFTISTSTAVTLAEVINFGKKYVALTIGEGTIAVDRLTTETEGSINEDD